MNRPIAFAIAFVMLACAAPAMAHGSVQWSVTVGTPGYYGPPPAVVYPPPAVVYPQSSPFYYGTPPSAFYPPPPIYVQPPAVIYVPQRPHDWGRGTWEHRGHDRWHGHNDWNRGRSNPQPHWGYRDQRR
ncbi:hypothetical protein D3870_02495 [Noviherbaspirillum cavernae]|uniref:Uncharacterized protein n=1 Tax=Noviherbaspirillum cavernae TaxID=2320862 RepID=A0A418WY71_9BURK|nr:hypothetical protein [Noviherbaspirillum cavernae]RJG05035.1 hypothetical protein D3870_02495 [Noviherbaspirillum cavernae]